MIRNRYVQTFLIRTVTASISVVTVIVTSRYLGAGGRGELALLGAATGIAAVLAGFVGGPAIVYLVPRFPLRAVLAPTYVWILLVSALAYGAVHIWNLVPAWLAIHVGLLAAVSSINAAHSNVLVGQQRVLHANRLAMAGAATGAITVLALFLVVGLREVWAAVIATYLAGLVTLLGGFASLRRSASDFDAIGRQQLWSNVRLSLVAQVGTLVQLLNYRLSFFVLEKTSGSASVGVYSIAAVVAESVWLLAGSIALVHYSETSNAQSLEDARRRTVRLARISLLGTLAIVGGMVAVPSAIFTAVLGKDFSQVSGVVALMSPGIVSFGFALLLSHYFAGVGRYAINTLAAAVGAIVTLSLIWLLVPLWQERGAAVVASLAYLSTTAVMIVAFLRESGFPARVLLPQRGDLRGVGHLVQLAWSDATLPRR
jgi:O-antigen/teichoic acid export membrane protein